MLCLAVRSGWIILTLKKNQEANTSAQEGFDCPRFCKAPNTLQNKPILAFQHTPFLDEQEEGGSHPHETHEHSGTATCEDRAWPRKKVSITSWRNYFPWGKFHEMQLLTGPIPTMRVCFQNPSPLSGSTCACKYPQQSSVAGILAVFLLRAEVHGGAAHCWGSAQSSGSKPVDLDSLRKAHMSDTLRIRFLHHNS